MDIKRARELLGKKGKRMTDEQITAVVNHLTIMVNIVIDEVIAMTPEEREALSKK